MKDVALCYTCRVKHQIHEEPERQWPEFQEFALRHPGHKLGLVNGWDVPSTVTGWRTWKDNSDVRQAFGAPATITITLAGLASGAASCQESTAVDNTTNLYLDALVYLAIRTGAGAMANDMAIYIYGAGSEDGANYTDNATGSNAALTLRSPTNLEPLAVISTPTSATTYKKVFSVARAFGGILPKRWSIIVNNFTGQSLDATPANHTAEYSGFYSTVTG